MVVAEAVPPRLGPTVRRIVSSRRAVPPERALLVALSGIDASGKGFLARSLRAALEARGLRAAVLGADAWLNLPAVRFGPIPSARRFYDHALRLDEMFSLLVLPLRDARSIRLEADVAEETAVEFRRGVHEHRDVDVVLLEGVFLLKRRLLGRYDLTLWIDCSEETALERAVARAQEGLPPEDTVRAYRTIYFPAQRIHLAEDAPRRAADIVLVNDPRLA